jgi:NDP-hexose-3-ketoreductase
MRSVRFGVLGCAAVAKRHVIPAMKTVSALELVAVASRNHDKASAYADEFSCRAVFGYDELLSMPDIDAVYMPLPTGLHLEWAHRALDAGKHVLIEKSLACDFPEARSIVEKARSRGLLVKENYMFEYHSQQAVVRELVRMQVGGVRLFRASFGFPSLPPGNFRYDPRLGGGSLLDAGGYVLKALDVFFPEYTPRVRAATLTFSDSGVDIAGAVMVDMESDSQRFPAHLAFGFDHHYQCNIEVWGSQAKLSTDRTFTAGANFAPSIRIETAVGTESHALPSDNHFHNILAHFANSLLSGKGHTAEYEAILKQAALQDDVRRLARHD